MSITKNNSYNARGARQNHDFKAFTDFKIALTCQKSLSKFETKTLQNNIFIFFVHLGKIEFLMSFFLGSPTLYFRINKTITYKYFKFVQAELSSFSLFMEAKIIL